MKGSNVKSKTSLTGYDFEEYFKKVNNPEGDFHVPDDDVRYYLSRYEAGEIQTMSITEEEIKSAVKA